MKPPYTVKRDDVVTKFPWIVVDGDGNTALWQSNVKVGHVPMRFKTEGIAHAAADKLNAENSRS